MKQNNPEAPPEDVVDMTMIQPLLDEHESEKAWHLLPSVVRRELLGHAPFGAPWSPGLPKVLDRLTEEGKIVIIPVIVTKDSDEQ